MAASAAVLPSAVLSEHRLTAALNRFARQRAAVRIPVELAARGGSWTAASLLALLSLDGFCRSGNRRAQETAVRTTAALIASYIAVAAIGGLIGRRRPFDILDETIGLVSHPAHRSFPSRHVTSASAMAVVAWPWYRRLGQVYASIALVLALSRVTAGLHYPTDVLGGALLGWVIGRLARIGMKTNR